MATSDGPDGPTSPPTAELVDMDPLSLSLAVFGPLTQIYDVLRVIVELKNVEKKRDEVVRHTSGLQSSVKRLEAIVRQHSASPAKEGALRQTDVQAIAALSRELLISIQTKLALSTGKPKNKVKRIRWAFQQRELSQKFDEDLTRTNALLNLYIQPLNLRGLNSLISMEPKVSVLVQQSQLIYDRVSNKAQSGPARLAPDDPAASDGSQTSRGSAEAPDSQPWLRGPLLNCKFDFYRRLGQSRGHKYVIVVRAKVGSHVVVAQLSGPVFNIFPRLNQVSLRNVVPEDAPIFQACRMDDACSVMGLLREGKASLQDVTPMNDTILAAAIKYGSVEVAELLLKQGANPNLSCGKYETSPLQLAVLFRRLDLVRTLLRCNADMEYVSANGRSLLHHVFYGRPDSEPPNAEFFHAFGPYGILFDDTRDLSGWSPLHRCAAYGSSEDMKWIIEHGGSKYLDSLTAEQPQLASHIAALFNNVDTLETIMNALARATSATDESSIKSISHVVDFKDPNGWTALHAAVERGAEDTTRWLLIHGADPQLQTYRTATWFPDGYEGQSLSVTGLAKTNGEGFFQVFTEALLDVRPEVLVRDEGDLYWDSEENVESSASDTCSEDCHSNIGLISEKD